MPVLNPEGRDHGLALPAWSSSENPGGRADGVDRAPSRMGRRLLPGLTESCANPECRSGWLQLWRRRGTPIFEEGWTCSAECTRRRVYDAVLREMDHRGFAPELHRHRIPLGLVMLEQGWITQGQLRRALDAQKAARRGRIGYWLTEQKAANEEKVTRALALQWNCPVLLPSQKDASALTSLMPRLFIDAFGALPLRLAAGRVLYLGFEESLDPVLALAIERMSGLQVESGVVPESLFRPMHRRILDAAYASAELIEASSLAAAAQALAKVIERKGPLASRLVRVHECLWLRLWNRKPACSYPEANAVHDVVCSVGEIGS